MKTNTIKQLFIASLFVLSSVSYAQVGVGTTDPKGALDVTSTSSGILIPRVTTVQRTAITVGADQNGMQVYDTDTKSFWFYDHTTTAWLQQINGKFSDGATNAGDAILTQARLAVTTSASALDPSDPKFLKGYVSPRILVTRGSDENQWTNIDGGILEVNRAANASNAPGFVFAKTRGNVDVPADVEENDGLGFIVWRGWANGALNSMGSLSLFVDGPITPTSRPTRIKFSVVKPNETSVSTALTIKSTHNVGIGTEDPAVKLDVEGYIKVGSVDASGDATPVNGMIRYNSGTNKFQGYANGVWVDLH